LCTKALIVKGANSKIIRSLREMYSTMARQGAAKPFDGVVNAGDCASWDVLRASQERK
jgi:hypothetical protein